MASKPRSATGLLDDAHSPIGGDPLVVFDVADGLPEVADGAILIGVDRAGSLPAIAAERCDALVTLAANPPSPWVGVTPNRLEAQLRRVRQTVASAPIAATVLTRVLRVNEALALEDTLTVESLAYSTLLGGSEFHRWLTGRASGGVDTPQPAQVRYQRRDDTVVLTLAAPATRNAITAAMRDALHEALTNVLEDPSGPRLVLRADGTCFSTGGHLPEFGTARDLAQAHAIRMTRSCADLLHRLGERASVRVHGACIGSGVEIAAAAATRIGAPGAFFQLPELGMGLIPGAGGTVTLPRAIGRHRTAWLVLGGFRIGAAQALDWGLLHSIEP